MEDFNDNENNRITEDIHKKRCKYLMPFVAINADHAILHL